MHFGGKIKNKERERERERLTEREIGGERVKNLKEKNLFDNNHMELFSSNVLAFDYKEC